MTNGVVFRPGIIALMVLFAYPLLGGVVLDGSFGKTTLPMSGPNSFLIPASVGCKVGGNLFQSFRQFNLNSSQSATFTGPANVQNILARVTSGSRSSIDGMIKIDPMMGDPNLFFMNPAGVLFGKDAKLNLSGSFAVTTANYLKLVGGGRFNASLGGGDVLTSAPVSAFGFLSQTPGAVSITGSNTLGSNGNPVPGPSLINHVENGRVERGVAPQKSFSVIAGDITMIGSDIDGKESRVNLVSVKSTDEAKLDATDFNRAIDVTQFTAMGRIDITKFATIITNRKTGLGGPVFIRGGTFVLDNHSRINSTSFDHSPNQGSLNKVSKIDVQAHDVRILAGSRIAASTQGTADAGHVSIVADSLLIGGQDIINTGLFALGFSNQAGTQLGKAGHITVTADNVEILSGGGIAAFSVGTGDGGTINVCAHDSLLIDGKGGDPKKSRPGIFADAKLGNGGDVTVTAGDVEIMNGGGISSGTFGMGNGGTITVTATSLLIDGTGSKDDLISEPNPIRGNTSVFQGTGILALGYGDGDGGNITLQTQKLRIVGGGQVAAATFGKGNGGTVTVTATGSLLIDGTNSMDTPLPNSSFGHPIFFDTGIFAGAEKIGSTGKGGDITVNAGEAKISAGGEISSDTFSLGQGGKINVVAHSLLIDGKGLGSPLTGILASAEAGSGGKGGSLTVDVKGGGAKITNSGLIAASTFGTGKGGVVELTVKNSLLIDGSDSGIFAVAGFAGLLSSGPGGDVVVNAGDLSLQTEGAISAASFTSGNAGSVRLSRIGTLSMDSGSSISSANTGSGDGGSVTINTTGPVTVKDGSSISTESRVGTAGDINLTSAGEIKLKDQSSITASAGMNGGNITITAPEQLVYIVDSSITATAGSTGSSGNGGNITINDPQFIVASNSLISANATVGTAGNVELNSDFLFTSNSTIFATGTINITAPTLDLGAQLITLPTSLLSAANQLQERCATLLQGDFSSFISIGRGGTEPAPEELQEEF